MADDPPKRIPANENPWYRLATVHGEQPVDWYIDLELHDRNRATWNRWVAQALTDDERAVLIKTGRFMEEDFSDPNDDDRNAVSARFDGMPYPDLNTDIDWADTDFPEYSCFIGFVFHRATMAQRAAFQGDAYFSEAAFQGDAEFREATFQGDANFHEAAFQGDAEFREATFQGYASFREVTFQGYAYFSEATFQDKASFSEAAFQGFAGFHEAAFQGDAEFRKVTFQGYVDFREAAFQGDAYFSRAEFQGYAYFREATFQDYVDFREAAFQGYAVFSGAAFQGFAGFHEAAFQGDAEFREAAFQGYASFREASFQGDADFHEARFHKDADFSGAPKSGAASDSLGNRRITGQLSHHGDTVDSVFEAQIVPSDTIPQAARREFAKSVYFSGVHFGQGVDFTNRVFLAQTEFDGCAFKTQAPVFAEADLHQRTTWRGVSWPRTPNSPEDAGEMADAYAHLRLRMNAIQNHEKELEFFARELRAKQVELGFWRSIPIRIYAVLSDYGQGLRRPALWLVALWYFCAVIYRGGSGDAVGPLQALGFSAASLGGLFGMRREFFGTFLTDFPVPWFGLMSGVQSVLGAVFVFLIGLALRNRFRIR